MKSFEELLKEELDKLPFEKGADDGQYNDGQLAGFEMGARWAKSLYDEPTKYEIKICHFSEVEISEEDAIGKMQDEGWEICGDIGVPNTRAWCGEKAITVPFKRVIPQSKKESEPISAWVEQEHGNVKIEHLSTASVIILTKTSLEEDGRGGIETVKKVIGFDYTSFADLREVINQTDFPKH